MLREDIQSLGLALKHDSRMAVNNPSTMTAIEQYPAITTERALGKSHNEPGIQEPRINEHSTVNLCLLPGLAFRVC